MNARVRVAVCGTSLYMVSVAAALETDPRIEVVRANVAPEQLLERLRELAPAAVALDLADTPADLPLALVRDQPGTLLLGMDPGSNDLLLFAGRQATALGLDDFVNIIAGRAAPDAARLPQSASNR
jgi:hypothetical protein